MPIFYGKINVIITFLISGLWHGIDYIWWGMIQGILCAFPIITKRKNIGRILTFILISFSWIFFLYPSLDITYYSKFLNISSFSISFHIDYILLILFTCSMFFIEHQKDKILEKLNKANIEIKLSIVFSIILIILLFGVYGIGFEINDFIYSKF